MTILTSAQLNWFNDGCCDVRYLDLWDKAPLNFHVDQLDEGSWHHDHYEQLIGHDPSGHIFQIAAYYLLRHAFYPETLMTTTTDYGLQDRRAKVGDRIVQRIHLLKFLEKPILDVIGMTEVTQIVDNSRHAMLVYATVDTHVEQGQWCASVEWLPTGNVVLSVSTVSRPAPKEPRHTHAYMRAFQKQAHFIGISHFIQQVNTAVFQPA